MIADLNLPRYPSLPKVRVGPGGEIKNETIMTYEKPENAHSPLRMNRFVVPRGRQIQFHPDERIPLYHTAWKLSPSQSKGGVMVWLESRKEWTERRRAAVLNQGER